MIVFRNPGILDLRCLRAFGVSSKPTTDNPIGQFGSGMKVAICILLRTRHKVSLYLGLDRYTFGTTPITIRGKEFDFVTLTHPDGTVEEMPFNTHVGEHWPSYAPFRELHSNVLDEGGETTHIPKRNAFIDSVYTPRADETAFLVEGDEIEIAYANRGSTFLSTLSRGAPAEGVAVHDGTSAHGYYRGVRVCDLRAPSLFTYNLIADQKLTEDRTLDTFSMDYAVCKHVAASTDVDYLTKVIAAPRDTYEHSLPCYSTPKPSDEFMATYLKLATSERMADISSYATNVYKSHRGTPPLPEPLKLNRIQQSQLDRAIEFCEKMGWTVREYPIVVIPRVTGNMLAVAKDGHIVLTEELFDIGTKKLAHALYEEWVHLKTGMMDETRALQTHLFQQVISLGEQIVGEAL